MAVEQQEYEDRFGEQEQSEARVVNISDEPVKFEIAQQPGSRPRRYNLAPFGREASGVNLQIGYTKAFRGAGRGMVTATIETLTEREIVTEIPPTMGPNGVVIDPGRRPVRVAFVVHEERAEEMRARYVKAMAMIGQTARSVPAAPPPQFTTARGIPARRATGTGPIVREDAEDQGGALDEPPPDDDLPPMAAAPAAQPEPVTIPKAPGGKGRG